jgi:hypothetical protein
MKFSERENVKHLSQVNFHSFRTTAYNGSHIYELIDIIASYFSYDIKTCVDTSMYNVTFFSSEQTSGKTLSPKGVVLGRSAITMFIAMKFFFI